MGRSKIKHVWFWDHMSWVGPIPDFRVGLNSVLVWLLEWVDPIFCLIQGLQWVGMVPSPLDGGIGMDSE